MNIIHSSEQKKKIVQLDYWYINIHNTRDSLIMPHRSYIYLQPIPPPPRTTHTEMTRLSQPCDKVVTTMSTIDKVVTIYLVDRLSLPCDKVVTTLWIGCHVKLRLSSLCYNLVCRLSQVSVTRSQP